MSDTDFEFDFFEDEPREEPPPERRPTRRPGPPPPRRPRGPANTTPLLRLAALIGFAILIIVLFVFWVRSCGESKADTYSNYMKQAGVIAHDSQQIGSELLEKLTTPGITTSKLVLELRSLAQRQQQSEAQAESLKAPGSLRLEQLSLLEALNFRVSGLNGLAAVFARTVQAKSVDSSKVGDELAKQAQRLTTSDIVWDDLFKQRSADEMKRQGVAGVVAPDSNFATSTDFGSSKFWVPVVDRLQPGGGGGTTSGGLRGTGLVSVVALPSQKELVEGQLNTVISNTALGFAVTVKDTGESQEVQVKVTLVIQQEPTPIQRTKTIDILNPDQEKTVTFSNLGQVTFATQTTLKVEVAPVAGESNTGNNSAEFPVIFSLA